jgi:hypothetical protein
VKNGKERKARQAFICPRCGGRGYLEVRHRGYCTYYYACHRVREDGRWRVRKCYLGPESYSNVERFKHLGLRGIIDRDRYFKYSLRLLNKLSHKQLLALKERIEQKLAGKPVET